MLPCVIALGRRVRLRQTLLHRQQLFQDGAQFSGIERVRSIGFGFLGIIVDFHKYTVDAGRHRRARQHRDELRLAAAGGVSVFVPTGGRGSCTEWVASKTTGANSRMMASERMSTTRLL